MGVQQPLSLLIPDATTLLSAYMPSLVRGGIFVPTQQYYTLGQGVSLSLTLPGERECLAVSGQVAWISPPGVSGRLRPGIGVHFDAGSQVVRERIEAHLAGLLDTISSSHTL